MTIDSVVATIKQYLKSGYPILVVIAAVIIILFAHIEVSVSSKGTEIKWKSSPSIEMRYK